MRALVTALILTVVMGGVAMAQSRTVVDPSTGNTYHVRPKSGGGARVDGFNMNTGSMWNTDIDRKGNMRGMDADMNSWTYDARSKTYMNLGTGQMCTGEGYARTCF